MEANRARPKIWAIVTLGRLDDLYREVVPEFQEAADIRVISLPVDEAVRAIESADPGQLDVAVSAGANGAYPDVKTFEQQGYKIYAASSRGFAAPRGTPKEIVERLAAAMKKVAESPEHQAKMTELGLTLRYMDPGQYAAYWTEYEGTLKELLPLTKEFKE
jgi:tripartite-type tricarboxylate transporter receptor subunit TctC